MIFYADSIAKERYAMNDNNLAISKVSNGKVITIIVGVTLKGLYNISDKDNYQSTIGSWL